MFATVSRLLDPFTSIITYTVRHGLAKGLKRQGGLGFLAPPSDALSKEEAFLTGLDLTGGCVYDIGGYEGLYTLFFARKVGPSGQVVCFEPIPASQRRIEANISVNHFHNRVTLHNVALGAAEGTQIFTLVDGESRGQATGTPTIQAAYQRRGKTTDVRVPVRPLDAYLGTITPPTFMKIDVEGMELDVILGARQTLWKYQPRLFIEIHGATPAEATATMRAIVRELQDMEYRVIHAEHGITLDPDSTPLPGSLHLYATV